MHAAADLAPAEDHQPDEAGLVHEGGDRLVAEHLAEERPGGLRERPVEDAEGHLHGDAGRHARGEVDDQQSLEEAHEAVPALVVGPQPRRLGEEDQARQADRQRRVEDVERRDPAEIEAREDERKRVFCHVSLCWRDGMAEPKGPHARFGPVTRRILLNGIGGPAYKCGTSGPIFSAGAL